MILILGAWNERESFESVDRVGKAWSVNLSHERAHHAQQNPGQRHEPINMTLRIDMPSPTGDELKAARIKAGLSQVDAAALMGYPVQSGSRGGLQSRTWQALESATDPRNMPGPIFAMFQLLTGTNEKFVLVERETAEPEIEIPTWQ